MFLSSACSRDAKTFQILDGTTQIQQLIISRHLERASAFRSDEPKGQPMQDLAIDYLCGHFTEDNIRRNFFQSSESEVFESVGRLKGLHGYTPAEFMAHLESLGIGRIIIPTLLTWDYWHQRPDRGDLCRRGRRSPRRVP